MSSLVYTNPRLGRGRRRARRSTTIALGYSPGEDDAPRILAAGDGLVGQKILEIARKNRIPIKQDPVLAAALSTVNVGEMIPPELYRVVAEVLAYIYRIQEKERSNGSDR